MFSDDVILEQATSLILYLTVLVHGLQSRHCSVFTKFWTLLVLKTEGRVFIQFCWFISEQSNFLHKDSAQSIVSPDITYWQWAAIKQIMMLWAVSHSHLSLWVSCCVCVGWKWWEGLKKIKKSICLYMGVGCQKETRVKWSGLVQSFNILNGFSSLVTYNTLLPGTLLCASLSLTWSSVGDFTAPLK